MVNLNGCVHINGVLGDEASGRTATREAVTLGIGKDDNGFAYRVGSGSRAMYITRMTRP